MAKENESLQNELSKIQAIKEIIAGDDIKEIRLSIKSLEEKMDARLDKLTSELTKAIQQLDEKLNTRMDKSEEKINQREDKLDDDKTDRHLLGKMLEEMGKKLQS